MLLRQVASIIFLIHLALLMLVFIGYIATKILYLDVTFVRFVYNHYIITMSIAFIIFFMAKLENNNEKNEL
jgi:hypothetical protein